MENRRNSRLSVITVFWLILSGCNENYVSSIPDYSVSLELNLTASYPTFKNSVNECLLFEKPVKVTDRVGYGGVIVYTGFDTNYYAFDMACPYEAKRTVKVRPNGTGQAVCDSCKSVYDISYGIGNPVEGPSREVLKRYKTALQGDYLYIYR